MSQVTSYKVGDCVWVKLKGFPHWPARIDNIDNNKYTMFYFGTHEVGRQKASTLLPFLPYRDKFTLYRGTCPKVLLEGVLEAEVNPGAKPDDQLYNINSDTQIWMVLGKEGQEDFKSRYPERAKIAQAEYDLYSKEMKLQQIKAGMDSETGESCDIHPYNLIPDPSSSSMPKSGVSPILGLALNNEDNWSECSHDSEIEIKMNVVAEEIDGTALNEEEAELVTVEKNESKPDLNPTVIEGIRIKKAGRRARKGRGKRSRVANLKLPVRKRVSSETIESSESDPLRKRRRTQSESVILENDRSSVISSPAFSSAPTSPSHQSSSTSSEVSVASSVVSVAASSTTEQTSGISSSTRSSVRQRNAAIAELDHCLRYSLRKSSLNEAAAHLILTDIEKMNISNTDSIDSLVASLTLVSTMEKLPDIKNRSASLLSKLGNK